MQARGSAPETLGATTSASRVVPKPRTDQRISPFPSRGFWLKRGPETLPLEQGMRAWYGAGLEGDGGSSGSCEPKRANPATSRHFLVAGAGRCDLALEYKKATRWSPSVFCEQMWETLGKAKWIIPSKVTLGKPKFPMNRTRSWRLRSGGGRLTRRGVMC